MRTAFFIFFLVGLLFFSADANACAGTSIIEIRYVGDSDKPVGPIMIGKSATDIDSYRNMYVRRIFLGFESAYVAAPDLLDKISCLTMAPPSSKLESYGDAANTVIVVAAVSAGVRTETLFDKKGGLAMLDKMSKLDSTAHELNSYIKDFLGSVSYLAGPPSESSGQCRDSKRCR